MSFNEPSPKKSHATNNANQFNYKHFTIKKLTMGKLQRNLSLTFMAFQRRIDRSSLHLRRSRMTDKRLSNEINDIFMETTSKHRTGGKIEKN